MCPGDTGEMGGGRGKGRVWHGRAAGRVGCIVRACDGRVVRRAEVHQNVRRLKVSMNNRVGMQIAQARDDLARKLLDT